jgi:hypothetical protein
MLPEHENSSVRLKTCVLSRRCASRTDAARDNGGGIAVTDNRRESSYLDFQCLTAASVPISTVWATSFSLTSMAWITILSPTLISVFWIGCLARW